MSTFSTLSVTKYNNQLLNIHCLNICNISGLIILGNHGLFDLHLNGYKMLQVALPLRDQC